ncbi:MAG: ferric reductase-like transmembrane domain-containing protein [Burkholderiaceae bacterium]|nr:ferric reductase-like transmembrane domain-containing protein [Burkholderiaceae bacterium]
MALRARCEEVPRASPRRAEAAYAPADRIAAQGPSLNPIRIFFFAALAVLTGLWLLADTALPQPFTWFSFRAVFVQWTGIIAIGSMSLAMLLALRPRWLEPRLGGLDKMYRLHKWLGIAALASSVLHWWWAQGTKWMVGWGWLARPQRGPRPDDSQRAAIEAFFGSQRGLAETLGEWAFYAAALLIVLALVKRFPYHLFARTHTLLAAAFLVLAWHAMVLVKFDYWRQPIGWLLAVLLAVGSVAALLALTGRIGAGRKVGGTVEWLQHYPALDVIESRIALEPGWPGHAAGQFAFVTSQPREGAHPYTIASAWNPRDGRITFITKALGDHTRRLREHLKPGLAVTVEGPYGCFDFDDGSKHQVWIGAGIGITPFVARMKQLAAAKHDTAIDLFHPTAVADPAALAKLDADARAAGVKLHLLVDASDGRLDGARLRAAVRGWADASIWFCGPSAFGQALRADLLAHGLPPERFHQELFEMR